MTTRIQLAGLTTHVVEPGAAPTGAATRASAAEVAPSLTCVLLHGFGASGDDLVPLAGALDPRVRFVFPEAVLELGGMYGGARAWWMIDLAAFEDDQRRGTPRDRRAEIPEGLVEARAHVLALIGELEARYPAGRIVLGGFSQGAMLALDVALHRPAPPAGLILMSGTPIAEAVWQPRMASLAGVPVMVSHGQHDPLLPFHAAEQMRDALVAAGANVDWQPFRGGHEIPPPVIAAAAKLLRAAR